MAPPVLSSPPVDVSLPLHRRLKLMAAVDSSGGIGLANGVPWSLPTDLKWLEESTKNTRDPEKQNAVIFGHRTYLSIPEGERPYPGRLNIVLSSTAPPVPLLSPSSSVVFVRDWAAITDLLDSDKMRLRLESVWVLGGTAVYRAALSTDLVEEVRMTRVEGSFSCDTFFPDLDWTPSFRLQSEKVIEENETRATMQVWTRI